MLLFEFETFYSIIEPTVYSESICFSIELLVAFKLESLLIF